MTLSTGAIDGSNGGVYRSTAATGASTARIVRSTGRLGISAETTVRSTARIRGSAEENRAPPTGGPFQTRSYVCFGRRIEPEGGRYADFEEAS